MPLVVFVVVEFLLAVAAVAVVMIEVVAVAVGGRQTNSLAESVPTHTSCFALKLSNQFTDLLVMMTAVIYLLADRPCQPRARIARHQARHTHTAAALSLLSCPSTKTHHDGCANEARILFRCVSFLSLSLPPLLFRLYLM